VSSGPRLLIRLGSLGDVVLATAAAHAARARWGDRCLDVLVKAEWAPVWERHPAVREVLPWTDRGLPGVLRMASRLRAAGYLETFDLQASPRTRGLALAAGLRRVHRPVRHALRRRTVVLLKRGGPPEGFSVEQGFVNLVDRDSSARPGVDPGPAARERARSLLTGAGRVALVPGARHRTKRWPLDRYVAVGRQLAVRGRVPVCFGPDEQPLLTAWKEAWPETGSWIAVREPLPVVAAVFERMDAVLTNDTGLMHLAGAVGTPVVAFFGPTIRSFGFAPRGERDRVLEVEGLFCRPCSRHGGSRCPQGHFRCMLDTEPARALAALDAVVAPGSRREPAPTS